MSRFLDHSSNFQCNAVWNTIDGLFTYYANGLTAKRESNGKLPCRALVATALLHHCVEPLSLQVTL